MQAVGNSLTPLCLLLFSSVLNVGLDIVFMGTLAMGSPGSGHRYGSGPGESALYWALVISLQSIQSFVLPEKELHVSPAFAMGMFEHGVSMGLMSAIYNIGSVVLRAVLMPLAVYT